MESSDEFRAAVLAKTAALMASRLRDPGNFQSGDSRQAGALLGTFTDATKPDVTNATLVTQNEADAVARQYPLATDDDAPLLVDIAALRSAIELEGSFYAEQVQENRSPANLWLRLLESKVGVADDSIGGVDEGSGDVGTRQLDAVWDFPIGSVHVPGSECPRPATYCDYEYRRLRW